MQITTDNYYLYITSSVTKRISYSFRWSLINNQCVFSVIEVESIIFWSSDYSIDQFIDAYIDSPESLLKKLVAVVLILRTFTKFPTA
jgi:hypothetical protein